MSKTPFCHLTAPDLDILDLESVLVAQLFDGARPYLVGSCLLREDYRDVDIRTILPDEHYDRLFPSQGRDALRHLIQRTVTDRYVRASGLNIDYQIQRMTEANKNYTKGVRHPLGCYVRRES